MQNGMLSYIITYEASQSLELDQALRSHFRESFLLDLSFVLDLRYSLDRGEPVVDLLTAQTVCLINQVNMAVEQITYDEVALCNLEAFKININHILPDMG